MHQQCELSVFWKPNLARVIQMHAPLWIKNVVMRAPGARATLKQTNTYARLAGRTGWLMYSLQPCLMVAEASTTVRHERGARITMNSMHSFRLLTECIYFTYPPEVESSSSIWGSSVLIMVFEDGIGKSIHCPYKKNL
jgi:hypothetical protein